MKINWKKLGWGVAIFYALKAVVYVALILWAWLCYNQL